MEANGTIWSHDYLRNSHEFSPAVQNHLKRFCIVLGSHRCVIDLYLTLFFALLASAIGAYIHMVWNIGGNVSTLGFSGIMIWLRFTLYEPNMLYLLFLFALLKGASVGPMIMLVIDFDSSVLVTAFVGTAVAFVCFSAAAMLATRREYLYHGASLACCMSILWWVQIASSIFGGSTTVVKFELYFGLLIFVGYIVVDTQMITEKAHHGDMDYVQHSFTFFTDFASLFVQILVLNMFRKMKKGRKDRRN
ncbi:Bax inhibitor-1 family protein [Arabidopsis thaliana]|uniref:Bax inhibitor-1 family protein n=1 Tax=Arabidopsis thaliana TaxID=3702 RepID=F4JP81_ARATH|nr:Bax inhibitor-1 family protein [Arabidopsis thaliana]AEE83915.1 Bax inhibitor-1 family protein [Arabidopsis thaliana]|eukprot:NP_193492.1 Bax inhibitor-1 family protein [Arabidopsis thaliana]